MESSRPDEEVELDHGDFVLLRYHRRWPHYVVEWTRRHRDSEGSSHPRVQGEVTSSGDADWEQLRTQALEQAGALALSNNLAPHAGQDAPGNARFFGLLRRKR